jgi:ribosomal protein S18 acetylase RimI-like enzyme
MSEDDAFSPYGLAPIRIEDKPVFDQAFATCPQPLSDHTFANTFIWREPINLRWRMLRDRLCVFANGDGGLTLLFPPLGDGDLAPAAREAMDLCRAYIADHGLAVQPRIEYTSDELRDRLGPAFTATPMSGDYVYATQRMIDLAGGDLSSKRQARNRFARTCQPRTEPFGPQHVEVCAALMNLWRRQCDAGAEMPEVGACVKRCKDVLATYEALCHCEALGLRGMVLYAGDRVAGFTLGEMLSEDTCSIIIEKTDRALVGSAQYIFSEFCRQAWPHAAWCNVGDDWDIPSLAWTKQSYRPASRLTKWVLREEAPARVSLSLPQPADAAPAAPAEVRTPEAVPMEHAACEAAPADASRFELGRALPSDLDRLFALEARCFAKEVAFSRRQWRRLLASRTVSTHVIRQAQEIVGEAILLRRRTRAGLVGRLYSIAVSGSHRGKGFGRMLLDNCLDVARAEGIASVYLEVDSANEAAIRLYQSAGFSRLRNLANYYGPGKDACKMVLRLSGAGRAAEAQPEATGSARV